MRNLIIITLLLACASLAIAAGSLPNALNGTVQGHAIDSQYTTALTGTSISKDLSKVASYSIYCTSDGKIRTTPTASKGATATTYPLSTIPGGSRHTYAVAGAAPFLHATSCTGDINFSAAPQ